MSATPIAAAKWNCPVTIQATFVVITNATTRQLRVLNKDLACVSIIRPLALTLLGQVICPPDVAEIRPIGHVREIHHIWSGISHMTFARDHRESLGIILSCLQAPSRPFWAPLRCPLPAIAMGLLANWPRPASVLCEDQAADALISYIAAPA